MEPFYINLGGFIVSSPAQRIVNFLLGLTFLFRVGLTNETSTVFYFAFGALQSGLGLVLLSFALFPKAHDRPYFLLVSEKGLEGRTGYFKQTFFSWDDIRTLNISAIDIIVSLKDNTTKKISLAYTPITELQKAKEQLTQWALQRGVLVHGK